MNITMYVMRNVCRLVFVWQCCCCCKFFVSLYRKHTQNVCTLCALIKVRGFVVIFFIIFFLFCITHKKMFCVLNFFFLWLLLCYCFGCLRATYGNICNMVINTLALLYSLQTVDRTVCAMCMLFFPRLLIHFSVEISFSSNSNQLQYGCCLFATR